MTKLYAGLALVVTAAFLGGSALWVLSQRSNDAFAQCRGGQVGGGAIGGPFTLVNQKGETVTEAEVLAKPALVYFGYTFCPDVCPIDNLRNAEAVDILEELGHDVVPVFVTVDPARDTPEVMADYAEAFHAKMQALSGSPAQVEAASKAFRVYAKLHEAEDEYYLVDHSTFTYLMLPNTGFAEFFKREQSAQEMADQVACFLENS